MITALVSGRLLVQGAVEILGAGLELLRRVRQNGRRGSAGGRGRNHELAHSFSPVVGSSEIVIRAASHAT